MELNEIKDGHQRGSDAQRQSQSSINVTGLKSGLSVFLSLPAKGCHYQRCAKDSEGEQSVLIDEPLCVITGNAKRSKQRCMACPALLI